LFFKYPFVREKLLRITKESKIKQLLNVTKMKIKNYMNLSIILFLIGILGFILNRKNIILMIISIEIMLLAVTLLILQISYNFDDNIGQIFSIYIISIAGAESVIGLSILVAYYRLRGTISLRS
jgi:NADH-ubiquinone oxidoreductase chain 4L